MPDIPAKPPEGKDQGAGTAPGREHQAPRYRGLYVSGRHATYGNKSEDDLYHGLASDVPTLYPEEIEQALAHRSSLLERIEGFRRKRQKLGSRDMARLGLLENELATIERRLTLHGRRVRGSYLENAKILGHGWEAYLRGLGSLLFFLEKSRESAGGLLRILRDPGRSSKAIVAGVSADLVDGIKATKKLSGEIIPPEGLEGKPLQGVVPAMAPPPEKSTPKRLIPWADSVMASLDDARLKSLDALLLAEARVGELAEPGPSKGPEATFVPMGPQDGPAGPISDAPDPGSAPQPAPFGDGLRPPPKGARSPFRVMAAICAGLALALLFSYVGPLLFPGSRESTFLVFNGLGQIVTVNLPGDPKVLAPGDRLSRKVPHGETFPIETYVNGHLAERLSATAPQGPEESLVYNVLGAVPFIEWVAHYGPEADAGKAPTAQTGERSLGAPKLLFTEAEFVLTMPPGRIKTKEGTAQVLTVNPLYRVHPELMLQALPQGARAGLIETHSRWNDPSELFLPLWLTYLVQTAQQNALDILEDRLADYPEDVWTLRALLRALPEDRKADLCVQLTEDSASFPDDPNKAYLRIRCLPSKEERSQGYMDLLEKYPDNAFLNRAAGLYFFDQGAYGLSLGYLRRAFYQEPRVMLSDMDFLARLMHYEGERTAVISSEIGPWSPHIRMLLSIGGAYPEPGFLESTGEAFRYLEEGDPLKALQTAVPPVSHDILYLCASSDGAPEALVKQALSVNPTEYLNVHNAWPAYGLLLREKRDTSLVEGFILDNASDRAHALTALELLKNPNPDQLDEFLLGLDPWLQGKLAVAAHVSMGDKAPARYTGIAKGFLFVGERPYLK
ncbi:MAG: hypothetical protein LBF40_02555 [Deltaproteobacteria bacterium]|jgi:hypothetical protein|nr:hypothetical protein [Deltaproteobacteria bacterium]